MVLVKFLALDTKFISKSLRAVTSRLPLGKVMKYAFHAMLYLVNVDDFGGLMLNEK